MSFRSGRVSTDLELPPRLCSPPHPSAVGSYGPAWIAWAEGTLYAPKSTRPLRLRPWQKFVLERGLEHDADGCLCHAEVGISVRRQRGKSVIIYVLSTARAAHAATFGQPQNTLHVANKLRAAYRIHRHGWKWAEAQGLHVSRSLDSPTITWADGSMWVVSSLTAAWGETATQAMVDESWDIPPEVIEEALQPTLSDIEIVQPQLWQFSTANREATAAFPRLRRRAMLPGSSTLLVEWSADPAADPNDPVTWRSSAPMWSPRVEAEMRAQSGSEAFKFEYLNIWPNVSDGGQEWPPGWGQAQLVATGSPPAWPTVAVETARDRSRFGVAAAVAVDGRVSVWSRTVRSIEQVRTQLAAWRPSVVLCGVTLAPDLSGGMWRVEPVGTRETGWATPILADSVSRGLLAHDHDPGMLGEVESAKIGQLEAGPVLSARRSDGPIPTVKAVCWAAWGALDGRFRPVKAAIW